MDFNKYIRLLIGVGFRKRAFTGPYLVQLDITNACNTVCLYCMNYSKLGLKEEYSNSWKKTTLDFETIQKTIPELKALGVKEIDVTGNGEPFSHPKCIQIIQLIKQYGMRCVVRTNGLLINKGVVDQLLDIGLDGIDLSLWAGTAQGYIEAHPEEEERSFFKIKDWLVHLAEQRRKRKVKFKLKILNVIGHDTFRRTEEMLRFADEVKADYVVFKYVLSEFFKTEIAKQIQLNDREKDELVQIYKNSVFKRKVRNNLEFLIKSMDRSFRVNNCYFGWLYSRLTVTGEVIPCCGCTEKNLGDFKKDGFKQVWYGKKYDEFRVKSKGINTDEYFKDCACTKLCPHYMPMISIKDLFRHIYQIWSH